MSSGGNKVFALIDCNNFFVSCERVFRPDTWGRPTVVLSNNDGCIIARSNEVKELGVPMAVPLFMVKDILKRHNATLFSGNFALYGDMSQRITSLISAAAPNVEVYSVDESFADLTDLAQADYQAWASELKDLIWRCTGIPVSIGVGTSKTLAKAAADYAKKQPAADGVHVVRSSKERTALLKAMAVEDVWGVGRRLGPRLRDQGVRTAHDLSLLPDKWVLKELTVKGLATVTELRGQSVIAFEDNREGRKSIGRSRSFGHTVRNYHQLESAVATFTAQAAAKMRAQGSVTGSIITYIKTSKHSKVYRSLAAATTLGEPTADTGRLITAALAGLNKIYDGDFGYQKAGVLLPELVPKEAWQLSLTAPDTARDKRANLMKAVDAINKKFGTETVWHAVQDRSGAQWHSKHELRSPEYTTRWSDVPLLRG